MTFLGSVAVARLLSPYDTGVFAIASAAVGLLATIQAMGLNNFLIREPDLTPGIISTAFTVNVLTSLLLAILVAALAVVGGAFFGDPGVRDVLLVIAAVPLVSQFAFLPNAMLEREGQFRTLALVRTGSTAAGLLFTIGFALAGFRYMSLAYSQLATACLTDLSLMIIARHHASFRLSVSDWKRISRFGVQIFAVSGLTRMAQRMSDIALGRIAGLPTLGLYSRAVNNYNMLWDNIHTIATRVLFVDFAALQRDAVSLRDRYLQVVTIITALLWPAFLGVAVLARPLVRIVYGERWIAAAAPLSLLCLAGVLLTSITMTWEIFVVTGETGKQARLEVVRTLLGFAMFVIGCLFGLVGAATARIGDAIVAQFLYRRHVHRLTGASAHDLRRIYLWSALLSAAAVAPSLAIMICWRWSPMTPAPAIVLAILAGGGAWVGSVFLAHHPLRGELLRLLRQRKANAA